MSRSAGLRLLLVVSLAASSAREHSHVRLISVDYGKTMGRWWVRHDTRRRWLRSIAAAKRASPQRLIRVHNVPADSAVVARLLSAGVDMIGTTDVTAFAKLFAPMSSSSQPAE